MKNEKDLNKIYENVVTEESEINSRYNTEPMDLDRMEYLTKVINKYSSSIDVGGWFRIGQEIARILDMKNISELEIEEYILLGIWEH
jgi:hypothetical protein